jgi:hypothetical protein
MLSTPGRVIEWGWAWGGANTVAFAPLASLFVAADVAPNSVKECRRQVQAVCDTPVEPLQIDIENTSSSAGWTPDAPPCTVVKLQVRT